MSDFFLGYIVGRCHSIWAAIRDAVGHQQQEVAIAEQDRNDIQHDHLQRAHPEAPRPFVCPQGLANHLPFPVQADDSSTLTSGEGYK